ncbi:hypothetical protein AAG747_22880 [Rapidithrix thailandica]|uniref:Uncharacterized protein n=1 Tax=Rapidithrix thailandica TaxID=413964 RepID=A0AAW9S0S9_9BACT
MKNITITFFLLLGTFSSWAQHPIVHFDMDKSNFEEGAPLPAASNFLIHGIIETQIVMVEILVLDKVGKENRPPLYSNLWKQPLYEQKREFYIPISYKLKGGAEYDFIINYYRKATSEEMDNLQQELYHSLDVFLEQNLELRKKKISLLSNGRTLVKQMNQIVWQGLSYYRNDKEVRFEGFSDLVVEQINMLQKKDYSELMGEKTSATEKLNSANELIRQLQIRLRSEVAHLFNTELAVISFSKHIDNYPVEKVKTIVTLYGGYGGVMLKEKFDEEDTDAAFMLGLSLPLGNRAFHSKFWSNTSVLFGFFLEDFEGENGLVVSGPIIDKPITLGLGYRVFEFMRLSAGAVVLNNEGSNNGQTHYNTDVYVRPFVGFTMDVKLWVGLGKR